MPRLKNLNFMKQKNENAFLANVTNKTKESKAEEQLLYNLLFSGKISLKEYLQEVNNKKA
jgi:hypothetical protein